MLVMGSFQSLQLNANITYTKFQEKMLTSSYGSSLYYYHTISILRLFNWKKHRKILLIDLELMGSDEIVGIDA